MAYPSLRSEFWSKDVLRKPFLFQAIQGFFNRVKLVTKAPKILSSTSAFGFMTLNCTPTCACLLHQLVRSLGAQSALDPLLCVQWPAQDWSCQNASESDGWHGEAGSQQNHWLILVCVNHHHNFMETCLLSPLLPLALRSLGGTHMMLSNFYKRSSCSLFPSPTHNTFLALILLDLTAAFEIIQVCSHNSISLSPLFPHSGLPLWGIFTVSFVELVSVGLRIKSKLSSFLYFFLGHFMQIHSFNVASKCESAAQTSTLSTHVPLDLSFSPWPNWWSHTDTHQVLCSLLWQMVSPLSCINENLGIVLDTCPFFYSKSIYHEALLTSSSYMFLNPFLHLCHCFRPSPVSHLDESSLTGLHHRGPSNPFPT